MQPHRGGDDTLDNGVEKIVGMLLAGERHGGIEVHRSPAPSLRGDTGKTNAGAALVMNPRQQDPEFRCDATLRRIVFSSSFAVRRP
jgi:hypothetical protein